MNIKKATYKPIHTACLRAIGRWEKLKNILEVREQQVICLELKRNVKNKSKTSEIKIDEYFIVVSNKLLNCLKTQSK